MKVLPLATEIVIFAGIVFVLIFLIFSKRVLYFYLITVFSHVAGISLELYLLKRQIFTDFYFLYFSQETRIFSLIIIFASLFSLLIFWSYTKKEVLNKEIPFLLLNSLLSMVLMVRSNNLFFSFLALEYLSFSIYIMIASFRRVGFPYESALKYFVLGSFASLLMLFGIFLLYLDRGGLNYSILGEGGINSLVVLALLFLFTGFAFKLAFVPFHIWTPDVFAGTPFPFISFISTVPKVSVFGFLFVISKELNLNLLNIAIISILTMFLGNFSALLEKNIKKIFAFSSIAHSGYILLIFLSRGRMAFDALIFYLITYSIMQMGALLCLQQLDREDLTLDGLKEKGSLLLFFFSVVFLLSLTGIPPTAGFYAKFYIFSIPLLEGYNLAIFLAFLNSVISAYYYLRMSVAIFQVKEKNKMIKKFPLLIISVLLFLVILLGVYPSFINILLK